mgnify:FL=1
MSLAVSYQKQLETGTPFTKNPTCEAEGCRGLSESFCWTAKHSVCPKHHYPFHLPDGSPMPLERIKFPKWKLPI